MTWREISPEAALELRNPLIIDVRSPCEHSKERILGSLNFPLLTDSEREEIGIVYKFEGEITARRRALTFISPKIPVMVDGILNRRQQGQPLLVYCWRGGLRSESVASILSIAGFASFRLTGGFKAWRNMIVKDLAEDRYPFQAVVLDGLTGVGKTEILEDLANLGCQILDLEKHANHRGSTFGGLGKDSQPSQKNFEEAIWRDLRCFDSNTPVFVEAESRKIGKLSVPDCVLSRIRCAPAVLITGSLEARSHRLAQDYTGDLTTGDGTSQKDKDESQRNLSEAFQLLSQLKGYLGSKTSERISNLLSAGSMLEAIALLLTDYYDPLYSKSIARRKSIKLTVNGDDPESAAKQIAKQFTSVTQELPSI